MALSWAECDGYERLDPGRCFGVGALVQQKHTRHGTAVAMEPTKLLVMDREVFLFALEALPMFSIELLASLESRLWDLRDTAVD